MTLFSQSFVTSASNLHQERKNKTQTGTLWLKKQLKHEMGKIGDLKMIVLQKLEGGYAQEILPLIKNEFNKPRD